MLLKLSFNDNGNQSVTQSFVHSLTRSHFHWSKKQNEWANKLTFVATVEEPIRVCVRAPISFWSIANYSHRRWIVSRVYFMLFVAKYRILSCFIFFFRFISHLNSSVLMRSIDICLLSWLENNLRWFSCRKSGLLVNEGTGRQFNRSYEVNVFRI